MHKIWHAIYFLALEIYFIYANIKQFSLHNLKIAIFYSKEGKMHIVHAK